MFRMHRDVRFSKDKTPYKTSISGLLTPDGTKAEAHGLGYIELGRGGGFAGFGRHSLSAGELGPIRDRIIAETDTFTRILSDLQAHGLGLMRDKSLKSMPRGYAEHDGHPHADEIRLTSMIVKLDLPKSVWIDGSVSTRVSDAAIQCADFMKFVSVS